MASLAGDPRAEERSDGAVWGVSTQRHADDARPTAPARPARWSSGERARAPAQARGGLHRRQRRPAGAAAAHPRCCWRCSPASWSCAAGAHRPRDRPRTRASRSDADARAGARCLDPSRQPHPSRARTAASPSREPERPTAPVGARPEPRSSLGPAPRLARAATCASAARRGGPGRRRRDQSAAAGPPAAARALRGGARPRCATRRTRTPRARAARPGWRSAPGPARCRCGPGPRGPTRGSRTAPAPTMATRNAPTMPPQKRSGTNTVKCQMAIPIITQTTMAIAQRLPCFLRPRLARARLGLGACRRCCSRGSRRRRCRLAVRSAPARAAGSPPGSGGWRARGGGGGAWRRRRRPPWRGRGGAGAPGCGGACAARRCGRRPRRPRSSSSPIVDEANGGTCPPWSSMTSLRRRT